jgi:CRISPR/Cas system-associated endonuclease Cas1
MATLILNRDSISVKLEANHLVIHEHAQGGSFTRMPLVDVERVIVVGQPAITFPVLAKFLDLGIPCSFLTRGGRWRGLMDGDLGFHAGRRMRQYAKVQDWGFALDLMEPFRSTWGDRLVLDLLNHHRIRADEHFGVTEEDGVYLNEEGRKIVFCAFDEMMDRRRMLDGRMASRRQIVETVVCRFIAAIESDEKVEFFKAA